MISEDNSVIAKEAQLTSSPSRINREPTVSNTLYIQNLNERVHIEDLKDSLYEIFCNYGNILQIVAKKNIKMRGQAFIVFDHHISSEQALFEQQNQYIFGKPMMISYSREKSDVISKRDGTFVPKDKRQQEVKVVQKQKVEKTQPKPQKNQIIPNNILFVEGLPSEISKEELAQYFYQYIGYREMRLISSKNVAFVEYGDEFQSTVALNALNGKTIHNFDYIMKISYAKK